MAFQRKTNWGAQNYQDATDSSDQDVSKINSAQLINIRIQNYWSACGSAFKGGDFETLRDFLNILWTEFFADAKKEEREGMIEIDKKINNALILRSRNKGDWGKFNFQYQQAVYEKWLFLKTLEKGQGLGKAYVDKEEDDWD